DPKKDEKAGGTQASLVVRRSPTTRNLNLKAKGDLSNAQFAVLGLKACSDAGIEIPKPVWEGALRYFLKAQNQDGGWGYYFAGVEELGRKKWYPIGAKFLLENQAADGHWWTGIAGVQWKQAGDIETADTCFAILFLTKATPPLTISEDARKK